MGQKLIVAYVAAGRQHHALRAVHLGVLTCGHVSEDDARYATRIVFHQLTSASVEDGFHVASVESLLEVGHHDGLVTLLRCSERQRAGEHALVVDAVAVGGVDVVVAHVVLGLLVVLLAVGNLPE